MTGGWLDTNVILRHILNDHKDHSPRARTLLQSAGERGWSLRVAHFTVAEVVFVLESVYQRTPAEIARALLTFSREPAIEFVGEHVVTEALADYRDKNVDFVDALVMAKARYSGDNVWTFNRRHFSRLAGNWDEPPERGVCTRE